MPGMGELRKMHVFQPAAAHFPIAKICSVMISIFVNGKTEQVTRQETIETLLLGLSLRHDRVAIELNGEILPTEQYAGQLLKEGDEVEIVTFVGGG